jgi:hypothetical protein
MAYYHHITGTVPSPSRRINAGYNDNGFDSVLHYLSSFSAKHIIGMQALHVPEP